MFDPLGGGLLILGAPGSGKTTALLELARDLLDHAAADQAKPIPVVFNLSSWAARRPPLAKWLADELRTRYAVARRIAQRWVAGGEMLPLLDGLDEVARPHRAGCVGRSTPSRLSTARFGSWCAAAPRNTRCWPSCYGWRRRSSWHPRPASRCRATWRDRSALADAQAALDADESRGSSSITAGAVHRGADLTRTGGRTRCGQPAHPRSGWRCCSPRTPSGCSNTVLAATPLPGCGTGLPGWPGRCMSGQSEFHLDRLQRDWLPTKAQQRLVILVLAITVGLVFGLGVGLAAGLGCRAGLRIVLRDARPTSLRDVRCTICRAGSRANGRAGGRTVYAERGDPSIGTPRSDRRVGRRAGGRTD
ncbi:MAG: NACHT domain-containing protein [Egibacteraceae bacterium]